MTLWFVYLIGCATIICLVADLLNYLLNNINMQFLKGKKTFIVSGLTLAYVLVGFYLGQGFNSELFVLALTGAGLRDALNPTK